MFRILHRVEKVCPLFSPEFLEDIDLYALEFSILWDMLKACHFFSDSALCRLANERKLEVGRCWIESKGLLECINAFRNAHRFAKAISSRPALGELDERTPNEKTLASFLEQHLRRWYGGKDIDLPGGAEPYYVNGEDHNLQQFYDSIPFKDVMPNALAESQVLFRTGSSQKRRSMVFVNFSGSEGENSLHINTPDFWMYLVILGIAFVLWGLWRRFLR